MLTKTIAIALLALSPVVFAAPASADRLQSAAKTATGQSFQVAAPLRCVAVAKRRGGKGKRIQNTRFSRIGSRACVRAMRACKNKLNARKRRGMNPYAACVVTRRFRG